MNELESFVTAAAMATDKIKIVKTAGEWYALFSFIDNKGRKTYMDTKTHGKKELAEFKKLVKNNGLKIEVETVKEDTDYDL